MSVKNKIEQIKEKAAKLAVKAAAVATLMTGTSAVSSCGNNGQYRATDENGEKIEMTEGVKTSVVFRTKQTRSQNDVLLENGDVLSQCNEVRIDNGAFLETGDTVTYDGNEVKAVRYKGGTGKQVNFGKIGKISKDITD